MRTCVCGVLIGGLMTLAVRAAATEPLPAVSRLALADQIEILPLRDVRIAPFDRQESAGWRMSLGGVDWSGYGDWQLAIRVRSSVETSRRIRVELLGGTEPNSPRWTYRLELGPDAKDQMGRRGFADVLVPLHQDASLDLLRHVTELKVVPEAGDVTGTAGTGQLPIHSIRLVPPSTAQTRPAAEILDDLAGRAFTWFEAYRSPVTGLVADRGPNWRFTGGKADPRKTPCSIASVGYYLSILPDAVKTGRLTEVQARQRAVTAMRFLETHAEHHAGLLHHFLDMETAGVVWNSEFSVLDSSILFNGCMVASVAFGGEVAEAADRLLNRVDWTALLAQERRAGRNYWPWPGSPVAARMVPWTSGRPSSPWRASWPSGRPPKGWIPRSGGTWRFGRGTCKA